MNDIEFYKKGNKIYIKKNNRGKFTDYCGGKVTDECIQRGKKSSDPKIRKRATFAANARIWKHQWGGPIVQRIFGNIGKFKVAPVIMDLQGVERVSKKSLQDFYNSSNYLDRLRRAGLWRAPLKRPSVIDKMSKRGNNVNVQFMGTIPKGKSNASKLKDGITAGITTPDMYSGRVAEDGTVSNISGKLGNIRLNTAIKRPMEDLQQTLDHELLHASSALSRGKGSTFQNLIFTNPKTQEKIQVTVDSRTGDIDRLMEYNKKLMEPNILTKKQMVDFWKSKNPNLTEEQLNNLLNRYEYVTSPQEWRARGLQLQLEANRRGISLAEYINKYAKDNQNFKDMRRYALPQQIYNYSSKALGLAIPTVVGAYLANNNSNNIS